VPPVFCLLPMFYLQLLTACAFNCVAQLTYYTSLFILSTVFCLKMKDLADLKDQLNFSYEQTLVRRVVRHLAAVPVQGLRDPYFSFDIVRTSGSHFL